MQYVAPQVDFDMLNTIQDEGWWLVFIAVLLALGATVVLGAAIWCIANGNGSFTGGVKWDYGIQVKIECK
ncbi:hypothetical protein ACQKND_16375 [Viridibacillus arvi]|uniref:hypothetical protein n=1 Tax=Viridibacillus arvi TaxID=263475 RepID=UPI003D0269C6